MTKKANKPYKKPNLESTRLTDEELDELAKITPEDIERAKAAARKYGSPLFNALLNADAEDDAEEGDGAET